MRVGGRGWGGVTEVQGNRVQVSWAARMGSASQGRGVGGAAGEQPPCIHGWWFGRPGVGGGVVGPAGLGWQKSALPSPSSAPPLQSPQGALRLKPLPTHLFPQLALEAGPLLFLLNWLARGLELLYSQGPPDTFQGSTAWTE